MIKNVTTLPPKIIQKYSDLLISPCVKFGDDLDVLWRIYRYIKTKLWKKLDKCEKRKAKCAILKDQFLDLYVKTEIKKEDIKTTEKKRATEPFYYIKLPDKRLKNIFSRLRISRWQVPNERRKDNEI